MPLIKKRNNAIWRVWSGPYSVGGKKAKKRLGVTVSLTIRSDKMPSTFSEDKFVQQVAELLVNHASGYDAAKS
jgi:hypothetical protein